MNNQKQTAEEIAEEKEIREQLNYAVKLGKDLVKLRNNPQFKAVIGTVFLKDGKDILWANIRNLREEELKGRGSEKNLKMLSMLDDKVSSRLDFEGFLDTVEYDMENAIEELENMDAEALANQEAQDGK